MKSVDKYEYRVKTEQMLSYMDKKAYKKAMEIADTIDWRRVKNASMLCSVSEIYENNGEYQKSRDVLFVAYDRSPGSRKIIYRLGILALKMNDINEATDCYEEFVQLAPKDPNQFILKYKILRAQKAPLSQQIEALVNFKKSEYVEKWAFELAKLYHEAGMTAECLEECDDLILWFSEGKYVYQAMELKMRYKPLTPAQQEKYRQRSEEKNSRFGKIATIRRELPPEAKLQSEKTEKDIDSEVAETEPAEEQREVISEKVHKSGKKSVNEGNEEDVKENHVKRSSSEVRRMGTQEAFIKAAGSKFAEEPEKKGVTGDTIANAFVSGVEVANKKAGIEEPNRRKSNLSQKTGTMKIEEILQNWEAQQREAARTIEAEKERYKEEKQKKVGQDTVQILSADIQKLLDELEGKESEKDDLMFEMPEEEATEELTSEEIDDLLEEPEEEPELENKADLVETLFVLDEEEDLDEIADEEEFDDADEPYEIDEDFLESDEELDLMEEDEEDFELSEWEEGEEDLELSEWEEGEEDLELSELEENGEELELSELEEDEEDFELSELEEDEEDLEEDEFDADYEVEDDFFEDEAETDFPEDEEDDFIENPTPMEEPDEDDEDDFEDYEEDSEDEDDEYEEELDFDEDEEDLDFEEEEDYEEESDFEEEEDYEEESDFEEEEDYEEETDFDEYPEEEYEELEEEIEEEEEPIEEIEEIEDTQSMIKRSPGGVVLDTGFVVQGRYDLEAQSEIGLKAGLTEEQKKLFSYFVPVRGMSEQIVDVLEADKRCKKRFGTSRTGNIVIVGRKGTGKTVLAVDVVKAIQKARKIKHGKVAIVTGEALNKKDVSDVVDKLHGGALIIERAGRMNSRTVRELNELMEEQTGELLFVLEEQRKPLDKLMNANPAFKKKFTSRLELPVFINDELVTFGQTYAKENGYRIDEMGILALYSKIDMMQKEDHAVTVAEVKEVMDAAIAHSQKANVKHLVKRVFKKGTDESDRIILKEDDFKL
ncbi:hypothetical protein KFE17_11535 [Faecalicatena sp. Marseille-Q4148]|nr:hypothetical protein KFE17_11535 [Faecalicatena sp. Marseille-Q4148]